jgi:SulP family sulfate permease
VPTLQQQLFPFTLWWRRVDRASLRADATAALVGAIVVLPQGVAFATLAGLPPEYGLYCAMVPAVVAALFGSSWHAVSGPTNAISLFVFATLAPLAEPGSAAYISLALTLSFMSGVLMLAMGALRMGALVNFVSHSVIVGFTAGAAVLIVASQLRAFFGVEAPRGDSFLSSVAAFVRAAPDAQPDAIGVGLLTLGVAVLSRRYLAKVPYMLVGMAAGALGAAALAAVLGADRTAIATLGALPGALPPLSYPELSADTIRSLAGIAIGVTVLGLTEAVSIARAIALKSGQRIDANQEFIGQGLSNIAASFFSGYPSSASFNRSGLNYEGGARTPLAAVLSAAFLAVLILGVAPLVAFLPLASMAAILFLVAWGLVDVPTIRRILRTSRQEAIVLVATFAATLLINLEMAILVGVILSLMMYLNRTSRPSMRSLVPDPRHTERKLAPVEGELRECPQLKILSIEGSIYFGAVNHVDTHFETLREVTPEQKHLLLVARNVNFVDLAGAELLVHEARRRRAMGGRLYLYGLRQPVEDALSGSGFMPEIGEENVFRNKYDAISGVFVRLDREICARCTARIFRECQTLPPPLVDGPR